MYLCMHNWLAAMAKKPVYKIKDFRLIWKVEKFLPTFEESNVISSPNFRISALHCINFNLTLKDGNIQLSVEKDPGIHLELNDCEAQIACGTLTSVKFSTVKLPDLPGWDLKFNSQKQQLNDGQLIVKCHIFLGENILRGKQNSDDENLDLLKLSRDIKMLYTSKKLSDVTLQVEDQQFKVHKTILYARSPKIVETLGMNADSSSTKHVSHYSSSVLKILLEYIYAAKIEPVHMEMSSGLLSAIDILKFEKLKEKLCTFPKEVTLFSHPTSLRTTFSWPISKMSTIGTQFPKKIMFSPLLCSSYSDQRQFEICLELDNLENSQNMVVSTRFYVGHSTAKYSIKAKTSIVDVFRELQHSQDYRIPVEKSDWFSNICKWNIIYSINKSIIENDKPILQPKDSLTFMFDFTIYKIEHEIKESAYSLAPLEDISFNNDDFKKLSSDLMDLYISEKFSDVTLKAGNHQFKAHKIIINARAPKLLNNAPTAELVVNDLSSDVLKAMLSYIYSANVANLTCGLAMKLYIAADKYELPLLKRKCLDFVKCNLSF